MVSYATIQYHCGVGRRKAREFRWCSRFFRAVSLNRLHSSSRLKERGTVNDERGLSSKTPVGGDFQHVVLAIVVTTSSSSVTGGSNALSSYVVLASDDLSRTTAIP